MVPRQPKYWYSETFFSIQGEGTYCGIPTVWLRLFGCNFRCPGFSQDSLDDPSSWELDYENVDVSAFSSLEQLPVFKRGCDSVYSWSKKFRHLAQQRTATEIAEELRSLLPGGTFAHPISGQPNHLAFTGGEPMMQQTALVDVMQALDTAGDYPRFVTIETNGTQAPRSEFIEYVPVRVPVCPETARIRNSLKAHRTLLNGHKIPLDLARENQISGNVQGSS